MKKTLGWLKEHAVVMYVAAITPYHFLDWQWWALIIPFIILLNIHDLKENK